MDIYFAAVNEPLLGLFSTCSLHLYHQKYTKFVKIAIRFQGSPDITSQYLSIGVLEHKLLEIGEVAC